MTREQAIAGDRGRGGAGRGRRSRGRGSARRPARWASATRRAASAIAAAITGRRAGARDRTGHRAWTTRRWRRKVAVVRRALEVNRPDARDGLDVLAKVGGFEIGGLVGVILAGAARRVPVVLDGFIAGAAALVAVALAPDARHALFAAHRSAEPGHGLVLEPPRARAVPRPLAAARRGHRGRALHPSGPRGGALCGARWRRSSPPA